MNFAIIIATYNRIELLQRAISSIRVQTHDDWRLYVCDDCSTDGTMEWFYSLGHPDGHHLAGVGKTRWNTGGPTMPREYARRWAMEDGRGGNCDFICFLGDDDMMVPNCLERRAAFMEEHPEADWSWCKSYALRDGHRAEIMRPDQPAEADYERLLVQPHIDLNELCIRTEFARQVGGFDQYLTDHEDWDYSIRLAKAGRGLHLPEALIEYRVDGDRLTDGEHMQRVDSADYIMGKHGATLPAWVQERRKSVAA